MRAHRVDVAQEIECPFHLALDLVHGAEDVSIVLLEPTHAGQSSQSTRQLIAVQRSKIGQAQRQLSPRSDTVVEYQAVAGAVHGL